jgi:hypothetical protein
MVTLKEEEEEEASRSCDHMTKKKERIYTTHM